MMTASSEVRISLRFANASERLVLKSAQALLDSLMADAGASVAAMDVAALGMGEVLEAVGTDHISAITAYVADGEVHLQIDHDSESAELDPVPYQLAMAAFRSVEVGAESVRLATDQQLLHSL